jgi:hypothetical protein
MTFSFARCQGSSHTHSESTPCTSMFASIIGGPRFWGRSNRRSMSGAPLFSDRLSGRQGIPKSRRLSQPTEGILEEAPECRGDIRP